MRDFLTIGGKKVDVILTHEDYERFKKLLFYFLEIDKRKRELGSYYDWNKYFCYCVWKCIVKKGFFIWKKPFRSKRHMMKSVLEGDEHEAIIKFVENRIMKTPKKEEDKETKN